jgi:alcohol dehydrogenase (NADP+)
MFFELLGVIACLSSLSRAQERLGPIQPPKGQPINDIPILGIGSWGMFNRTPAIEAFATSLQKGFRHFDTAAVYGNEDIVGLGIAEGLKRTGLRREDVWVTTKLWNNRSLRLI